MQSIILSILYFSGFIFQFLHSYRKCFSLILSIYFVLLQVSHERLSGEKAERKEGRERGEKVSRLSDDKMAIDRLHEEKMSIDRSVSFTLIV